MGMLDFIGIKIEKNVCQLKKKTYFCRSKHCFATHGLNKDIGC